jgi:hypothetical protein
MWAGRLSSIIGHMLTTVPLTIRFATPFDAGAISTLAELDSSHAPRGDVLVAYVGEELWAALSVDDGHAVADPMRPSLQAVSVLAERRRQLRRPRSARRRSLRLARA